VGTTYEFKTNCASVFVSHKGPAHMLNTFIHTLDCLCLKIMLVFIMYIAMQANKYFNLFIILEGTYEMIFLCLNPCLQVCYNFEFLCHVNMKCDFFSFKSDNMFAHFANGLKY